ncbi:ATP-dependent DNA helicase [Thiomicrospira sp. R3]|uniref:ATP-dependent DNA helicase n=1 Tax=Thiomicrospira sp. R3 TaxID=3035472 RepID=UPI00259BAF5D|nr:ATP-dependent DNA helicase [Thiomicrospira sp. R3]WFE68636.1 ATP-dependent DNA helicase [Thiomicrospira sp. R3]
MTLEEKVETFLGKDGKLKQAIVDFSARSAQVEMAKQVASCFEQQTTLVAEAGTGTGKTFAYLVPALLSGKKVIISTATKNLQQQLIDKDLPLLKDLCGIKGVVMQLKGRENYLCEQRLHLAETQQKNSREDWQKLAKLRDWAKKTKTGDLSESGLFADSDLLSRKVCARLEFCQAVSCNKEADCFYPKIKLKAAEAQVLVVNHHLFCADLSLREQGFGELLPNADCYIFDEAHQLPDIAAQFLGFSVSRFQLEELCRDIKQAKEVESPESEDLIERLSLFQEQVKLVNEALGKWEKRWNWEQLSGSDVFIKQLERLINHLAVLADHLKALEKRGKLLTAVAKRSQEIEQQLKMWLETDKDSEVRWAESSQARFKLNMTPLSVADPFKRQREAIGGGWVFTSATLSLRDSFDYFKQRLGLFQSSTAVWPSPFDYKSQGLIYHPVGLPDPRSDDYIKICMRAVWPLLLASDGRAFLLFTSFRALNEAKALLQDHWKGLLLVQGEDSKSALLSRFREEASAILLGTSSFWEGVDVRGQALQLVLIDRIPFLPPDDPIVQARESYLKQKGLNGFAHFQLPEAIMALKQGVGRLIRDQNDKGVLVLCDPRFTTKRYGQNIVNSLPDFPWVYQPDEAIAFLKQL